MAQRGGTAPEPSSTYRALQRPAVGDAAGVATVVFNSQLRSVTAGNIRGVFAADTTAPSSTIILGGEAAPPTFARTIRRFNNPTVNATPIVVFEATSVGGDRGIYRSNDIAVSVLGDTAPGGLLGLFSRFAQPQITDNAGVMFRASISEPTLVVTPGGIVALNEILMRCVGGDLDCTTISSGGGLGTGTAEILVQKNEPIPDRPGRFVCGIFRDGAHASDWGIAFRAETKLDCGDEDETAVTGLFRRPYSGPIQTIAMQGELANPFTLPGGTTYGGFANIPVINNAGTVAFVGNTKGLINKAIIFRCELAFCPATYAEEIVRASTTVEPGVSVTQFLGLGISTVGDISFRASVNDTNVGSRGKGIYVYRAATALFDRLAVKGDLIPGGGGAQYRQIFYPAMSPQGRVAFRAKVKSPGGQNTIQIYLID